MSAERISLAERYTVDREEAEARAAPARTAEARTAEARATEAQAAEARAAAARAAEARAAEAQAAEARAAEARAAEARAAAAAQELERHELALEAPRQADSRLDHVAAECLNPDPDGPEEPEHDQADEKDESTEDEAFATPQDPPYAEAEPAPDLPIYEWVRSKPAEEHAESSDWPHELLRGHLARRRNAR